MRKRILSCFSSEASRLDPKKNIPTTFYRRPLPSTLVSFTSSLGNKIFRDSLASGYAENYFHLVGNFTTQSEPSFCALGSLAMVLNALEMDPGKKWKGSWRWYSDENLECSSGSEVIKTKGVTFREFSCLAKCNGLSVQSKRADFVSFDDFVDDLKNVCSSSNLHMIVSFCRKTLGQTGDGHFSPIGGFDPSRGMALVLDTARFKYPSYYVSSKLLYDAMQPLDSETGLPRGYFLLGRSRDKQQLFKPLSLCKLTNSIGVSNPKLANLFCRELPLRIKKKNPQTLSDALALVLQAVPSEYSALIRVHDVHLNSADLASPNGKLTEEQLENFDRNLAGFLSEVASLPLFNIVKSSMKECAANGARIPIYDRLYATIGIGPEDLNCVLATVFILSCPREIFRTLRPEILDKFDQHRDLTNMSNLVGTEIEKLSHQISSLMNDYCQCFQKESALSSLPGVRLAKCLNYVKL